MTRTRFSTLKLTLAAAAIAITLAPLVAQATTASADFYGFDLSKLVDKSFASYGTTLDGVGLTITAVSSGSDSKVTVRWDGIGMRRDGLESGALNSQLFHSGDALLLSFDQAVIINSITLSGWDMGLFGHAIDQASITTRGVDHALSGGATPLLSPLTTFSLGSTLPAGQFFALNATGSLSAFRLAGLSVTALPEASTFAMMALGLGGLLAARRRGATALSNVKA